MDNFKYVPLEDRLKYFLLSALVQCGIFIFLIQGLKQGELETSRINSLPVFLAILTRIMIRKGNTLWNREEKYSKWLNLTTIGLIALSITMIYTNHVFVRFVSDTYFKKVGEPFTQITGYIGLFGSMIVATSIMFTGLLEIGYLWRLKEEREGIEPAEEEEY